MLAVFCCNFRDIRILNIATRSTSSLSVDSPFQRPNGMTFTPSIYSAQYGGNSSSCYCSDTLSNAYSFVTNKPLLYKIWQTVIIISSILKTHSIRFRLKALSRCLSNYIDISSSGMLSLKTLSCLKTVLRQVFSVLVLVLVLKVNVLVLVLVLRPVVLVLVLVLAYLEVKL